jgi:2Fe-2S ferredoxin
MPIIVIKNMGEKAVRFENSSKTLLRHLQDNYIDWMQACGGKGRCTTCKVNILGGAEYLGPKTAAEMSYMRKNELGANERLACQCVVTGDVCISVPEEAKLPHVSYTD